MRNIDQDSIRLSECDQRDPPGWAYISSPEKVRDQFQQDDNFLREALRRRLNDVRSLQAEVEALRAELQNKAAEKMPNSFVKMSWACGHEGSAACGACFRAACDEREALRADAEKWREHERVGDGCRDHAALWEAHQGELPLHAEGHPEWIHGCHICEVVSDLRAEVGRPNLIATDHAEHHAKQHEDCNDSPGTKDE